MDIYVGNLSYEVIEADLRPAFVAFGTATRVSSAQGERAHKKAQSHEDTALGWFCSRAYLAA
jgi:hypothetical protein